MTDLSALTTRAATRHGLLTIDDLAELGINRERARRLVASGVLHRPARGVYRVAGAPVTWHQQVLVACLAHRPTGVASHRCAARLWDLRPFRDDDVVEVSVARTRQTETGTGVRHRSKDLCDAHVTTVAGIPVTTPARTVVDLGAVAPDFLVATALEQLLVRRLLTVAEASAMVEEVGRQGRNGVGVLRAVLERRALGDEVGDSGLEAVMAQLLVDAGLPLPVFQYELVVGGVLRRLDFAFPDLRIAIEVDGFERHTGSAVFEDDRVRGNALELAGWLVLRFTMRQILDHPGYVAAAVARAIRARTAA